MILKMHAWQKIWEQYSRPEVWVGWFRSGVHVLITLALAWIATRLVRRLLVQLHRYTLLTMDRRGDGATIEMEKRANTVIAVMTKAINFSIWIVAIVQVLSEVGYRIEPLLAGLGVAGIAIGLGAQAVIKDWLGGFFLLIEDQARIGDSVMINGFSGSVEEINLRTTLLRGENGAVHVIANGSITTLSNMTRDYSFYVFETTLAHGADVERALEILGSVGVELQQDEQFRLMILAPIEVMGVDRLADRGTVIKARIKTLPSKQAFVGRELNRRVRIQMENAKISFAQPLPFAQG